MQRNLFNKNPLITLLYVVVFILYSSLSSIYPILPPLFALLLVLFSRALEREETFHIVLLAFCLVIFEANNGYILFSSIIYFYLIYKILLPKIYQNFSCLSCVKISSVFLAYIGYFLFLSLVTNIFLLPTPNINYYVIYYMVIEFFLVSLL